MCTLSTIRVSLGLAFFFALLASADYASALSYRFCATVQATFSDNNVGELHWVNDAPRPMSFADVEVVRYSSSCSVSGTPTTYVARQSADIDGCTPLFSSSASGCFRLRVWSLGDVSSGPDTLHVQARDSSGNIEVATSWVEGLPGSGTYEVQVGSSQARRMYVTHAYSYLNFSGSIAGEQSLVAYAATSQAVCGCGGSGLRACYSSFQRQCIGSSATSQKFMMGHEFGHAIVNLTLGSSTQSVDYSEDGAGHQEGSQEWQSAAIQEGWAHFVASDIFNRDHSETGGDGYFQTINSSCGGGSLIRLETDGDDPDCVVGYMEDNFSSGTWPGHGAPVDWLRTFWDYHTNGSSSWPTHTQMIAELLRYNADWNGDGDESYDALRIAVATESGCGAYERLADLAIANGAAHCEHDVGAARNCDNVPGCTDVD